ncbi:MAG: 5-formyltetrahydrofolate cyclo-ligase [Pseudanabaenaceae cyanobacterium bins.68]|nr:5-formyltetrahydrofolate cyclo-ligase [Pseudanabaenaceae cyanobacterium bins.68]
MNLAAKQILRQQFRHQRQQLELEQWQSKSALICRAIAEYLGFKDAQTVLAYVSHDREPDLSWLWLNFPHKVWGLPRCLAERQLSWHRVNPRQLPAGLVKNKFGIYQPNPELPLLDLGQVDLILVPTLACDRDRYRLGYGGGYYDYFLSAQPAIKLGVVFADALVEQLPIDPWDIPLDLICTEDGIQPK